MAESMADKIAKRLADSKSTTDSAAPAVRVVETETLKNDSKSGL